MVAIGLSAPAVARIRIGVSCLWEVLASARILRDPGVPEVHRRWAAQVRLAPGLLRHLVAPTGGYTPDFLTPPPSGLTADLDRDLAGLRATPPEVVRSHLDLMPGERPAAMRDLYVDPLAGLDRLAEEIAAYWQEAIVPDWPRMRSLLEAEVQRRARRLAETGSAAVLNDLHPAVTWTDRQAPSGTAAPPTPPTNRQAGSGTTARPTPSTDRHARGGTATQPTPPTDRQAAPLYHDPVAPAAWAGGRLEVDQRHCSAPDMPDAAGLVLVPSVFVWPSVMTVWAGQVPQLAYPARGVATLWERSSRAPGALGAVIGRGRARLLAELGVPLSTTELARRTGISAGGVSQHLSALRAAGLVITHRQGRTVLNSRTAVAEALLTAAGQSGSTSGAGVPATQVTVIR
ncbi:helix-turn-helix domain-containing protein [Actinoplanes sp. NPDC051411]|uniref:helix-turn-helix domain-containing protein n=1 Tax=Actinoplanes sp. NPDC051411 TaxID=3155522 RepID=UPI00344A1F09